MHTNCKFCHASYSTPTVVSSVDDLVIEVVTTTFPLGSVFLFSKKHFTIDKLPVKDLSELGPLLSVVSKMMVQLLKAEKVYVVSFSERYEHMHFLVMPKTTRLASSRGDSVGPKLVQSFLDAPSVLNLDECIELATKYRTYLKTHR